MPALGIVPDGVVGTKTNPVRNRPVLSHLLSQLLLNHKRLVRHQRYAEYLDSFEPEEVYLKKKVEMELGTKMIHLKMRCSGLGSEWGKVTVLGTSGLSGSYVEQRA